MSEVSAYGVQAAEQPLKPMKITRREPLPTDVVIDIKYCGVCHTDLHYANNDWGMTQYPLVPGHEIVGQVVALGSDVSGFEVGDNVAVGCLVGTCGTCGACVDGLEQYCEHDMVGTYGSSDPKDNGAITMGGYSARILVDQHFVLRVPDALALSGAAPLLCAGITTWSPLRHWDVKQGQRVGVIGLGGLGHMGVKFAKALGAQVTMITTSPAKAGDAHRLGADTVLISTDPAAMKQAASSFDFLLDTIPVAHDINDYTPLLKRDGTLCVVGALGDLGQGLNAMPLMMHRASVAGSIIGGIKATQEMLDFCGEHNIVADVEVINVQDINEAYTRMLKSDVKYRFVIDMSTLQ
jgi:uncharacterized zinc-type alcohol dehydrogenase-like protein